MEFNWLGVAFVSERLPVEIEEMVETKMEELKEKAKREFDEFLDRNDLEQVMGVIVRKGSVK
jgi:succinate dehydrogenase flavin-adding protein (antitoxin of CptAB toxin-antitoxin module)